MTVPQRYEEFSAYEMAKRVLDIIVEYATPDSPKWARNTGEVRLCAALYELSKKVVDEHELAAINKAKNHDLEEV